MKLLYFSDNHPSLSSFILQDVNKMSEIHEVCYLYSTQNDKNKDVSFKTKYIDYPSNSLSSRIKWHLEKRFIYLNWYNRLFSRNLNDFINEFKPNLIHCQFGYEALKLIDNYKSIDVPVVINFRGYDASYKLGNKKYVNRMREILNRENVHSIFVCKALKENLVNKGIAFKNKPNIIYTGVDISKFKIKSTIDVKEKTDKNLFHLLQTGSFTQKKGHFTTIRAFYTYLKNHPNVNSHLSFIGEGTYLKPSKNLVEELGIGENVSFLGYQNHDYISKALNDTNAFIHHSVTAENGDKEGIPNAIIEAMAMKLPILSSIHSGIPEAVEHGVNGLLCKERDIETLAEQMHEITSFKKLDLNRQKIENKFSLDLHIKNILKVYENCLKKQ